MSKVRREKVVRAEVGRTAAAVSIKIINGMNDLCHEIDIIDTSHCNLFKDKVGRMPDVMDFYNEDYFVHEPTCISSEDTCNAFRSFKPKLKTADLGRYLDLYKHMKMWDGLPY